MHGELGGMEAPGALEVARVPSVNVPVCVYTSVLKCVLQRTHSGSARACVRATPCVEEAACAEETARVCEQLCGSKARCVKETPWVSAPAGVSGMVYVSEAGV